MKDYYMLIGLNSKEVKITKVNQNNNGLIEIAIENRKKKVRLINLQVQYMIN